MRLRKTPATEEAQTSVVATLRDMRFVLNVHNLTHRIQSRVLRHVSVRIDPVIKKRLEGLAESTGRSRSFLAAEAINDYPDLNEWQVAGIQRAISSFDEGRSVSHRQAKTGSGHTVKKSDRGQDARPHEH